MSDVGYDVSYTYYYMIDDNKGLYMTLYVYVARWWYVNDGDLKYM